MGKGQYACFKTVVARIYQVNLFTDKLTLPLCTRQYMH